MSKVQRYYPASGHGAMIILTSGVGYVDGKDYDALIEKLKELVNELRYNGLKGYRRKSFSKHINDLQRILDDAGEGEGKHNG